MLIGQHIVVSGDIIIDFGTNDLDLDLDSVRNEVHAFRSCYCTIYNCQDSRSHQIFGYLILQPVCPAICHSKYW